MKLSLTCMAIAAMIFTSAEPAWAQAIRIDPTVRTMASGDVEIIQVRRGFRAGGYRGGGARFAHGGRGGYRGGYARGGRGVYARGGYARRGGYAYRGGYGYRRGWGGYGVGAGVAGLAAGAAVGGAIAASQANNDAVGYCASRYRSYDPQSGTYLGNDGLRHPCP
jgi:hypothetical protein